MASSIGEVRGAEELPLVDGPCPACGSGGAIGLPIPAADRSMLSDGRIIARPLDKLWCRGCGLVRHRHPPAPAEVSAIYSGAYGLPALTGPGEQARGEAYASAIIAAVGERRAGLRLLDVGCGSGAMLRALHDRDDAAGLDLTGIDPALPASLAAAGERLTLKRGLPDRDLAVPAPFDVVTSINTIEHTPDPAGFLSTLGTLVGPNGLAIVICPTAEYANNELLFFDHFWSISTTAMIAFSVGSGLQLIRREGLTGPLAGFQLFKFRRSETATTAIGTEKLSEDAISYLSAWKELDASLERQLAASGKPAQVFGAGQMAALLRAYAPNTFARVKRLLLDHPEEAWPLGPAVRYDGFNTLDGWVTLVAVHPLAQDAIAARIQGDGGLAVKLPAAIRN
jgi:SAM-dependent methyltransferase